MKVPVDALTERHIYLLRVPTLAGDRWIAVEFLAMRLEAKILWLHFRIHAKGTPWEGCLLTVDAAAAEIKESVHELDLFDEMTP